MEVILVEERVVDATALCLAIALLAVALAIAAFDIAVQFGAYSGRTVSDYIYSWSRSFPLLPFIMGMVAGHLWFTR